MNRRWPLLLVLAAVLGSRAIAEEGTPAATRVDLANASFDRVVEPKAGSYACCFADWLFKVRSGRYVCGAKTDEEGDAGSGTCARVSCTEEAGRADLMSPFLALPAWTAFHVKIRVRSDGGSALIALHPPYARRLVDLALVGETGDAWVTFETTLRTGAPSEAYRFTLALVGEGEVCWDELEVVQGETRRPDGTAFLILDVNDRSPGWQAPDAFWMKEEIEGIWGYEVHVRNHAAIEDDKAFRDLKPAGVLLTPLASRKKPPGDREERVKARRRSFRWLAKVDVPTLGICLGHQWLGLAAGVRNVRGGETGDVIIEHGTPPDPVFRGLPPTWPCSQSHRYQLERVPPGYRLLARSEACEVQAIRRTKGLVYGIQGHVERGWAGTTPHGRIVFGNFMAMLERPGPSPR